MINWRSWNAIKVVWPLARMTSVWMEIFKKYRNDFDYYNSGE
jgi:hypothetical protein